MHRVRTIDYHELTITKAKINKFELVAEGIGNSRREFEREVERNVGSFSTLRPIPS